MDRLRPMGSCPDGSKCKWKRRVPAEGADKICCLCENTVLSFTRIQPCGRCSGKPRLVHHANPLKSDTCVLCGTTRTKYVLGIIKSWYDGKYRWRSVYRYTYADGHVQYLEGCARTLLGKSADIAVRDDSLIQHIHLPA